MGLFYSTDSNTENLPKIKYEISVKTGDKRFAGSDASVEIVLRGDGLTSETICLGHFLKNDFERGQTDTFTITTIRLNKIDAIEIHTGFAFWNEWFVETVEVKHGETGKIFIFPIHRWIKQKSTIKIAHLDTSLPQFEMFGKQRRDELYRKRNEYQLEVKIPGLPPQVKKVPKDERFSKDYLFDLGAKALAIQVEAEVTDLFIKGKKWRNLDHIKQAYPSKILPLPDSANHWSEDETFGRQRISSINNCVIELCRKIPEKFPVTEDMVNPFLQGTDLHEAIEKKRIFIVDHDILDDIPTKKDFVTCAPMALFFLNNDNKLMPIAIQLYQRPSDKNPIFLPSDPKYTWMMAKLWFNNADTAHHQSITHLGFTHLQMESIYVVTHRQLSQSHPLFKLLAPHFLYIIAINSLALKALIAEGQWVDETMNMGIYGMFEIIKRRRKTWKLDTDGTVREDIRKRGVLSPSVLPGYYFRDDAVKLFDIIEKYVNRYVDIYYGDDKTRLTDDYEVQNWIKEIVLSVDMGGVGLNGVPCGSNGELETKEQLVSTLTSIIYLCSVGHAAANFQQYDEYGFPPNYPAYMTGKPPKDKTPLTEQDVLDALPDQGVTLSIMTITKVLSEKATNSLGYFENRYIYDTDALVVLKQFRDDLDQLSQEIQNAQRDPPYQWLDPKYIPNAISI